MAEFVDIRDAVMTQLKTNWTTTKIKWPGDSKFVPDNNSFWVEPRVIPINAENASLGSSHQRYTGWVRLHIRGPKGHKSGDRQLHVYADSLAAIFRNQSFSGVRCWVPSQPQVFAGALWQEAAISVPFRYDKIT